MGKIQRKHKVNGKILALGALLLIFLLMCISAMVIKCRIEPNLEEIGKMRANVMVSQIINKALNNQLYEESDMDQLLIRKTNKNGKLEVLEANTQAMNLLITEISKELQVEFANRKVDLYEMPLGSLLGNRLLSNTGPSVTLKIIPTSVMGTDFKTEFETQGINQTKYKVYVEMVCQVKVLVPFASETFKTKTTVLVAEAVILGEVPNSYVEVPEEDILDVTE